MSPHAEEFRDALYARRHNIFMAENSGTAPAEFPLEEDEDFDDPVVRCLYGDDDKSGLIILGNAKLVTTLSRDWTVSAFSSQDMGGSEISNHFAMGTVTSAVGTTSTSTAVGTTFSTVGTLVYSGMVTTPNLTAWAAASTLPLLFSRRSKPRISELDWSSCFAGFVDEEIEDGMTASLGEKISNLIQFHGSEAIKRLKELICSNKVSPSLASHTLRWLGRSKDSASFNSRLELLCESLRSKSSIIRDGASLGLAALGSTKAIRFLQDAINQEKLPGLRADMEQVLKKLQN
jgi:hypothetical protein